MARSTAALHHRRRQRHLRPDHQSAGLPKRALGRPQPEPQPVPQSRPAGFRRPGRQLAVPAAGRSTTCCSTCTRSTPPASPSCMVGPRNNDGRWSPSCTPKRSVRLARRLGVRASSTAGWRTYGAGVQRRMQGRRRAAGNRAALRRGHHRIHAQHRRLRAHARMRPARRPRSPRRGLPRHHEYAGPPEDDRSAGRRRRWRWTRWKRCRWWPCTTSWTRATNSPAPGRASIR
jgi:hypothetical protein